MKKIFCLLGLLMAFNVHAADLDLAAVLSGRTNDSVCFLSTSSGGSDTKAIICGSKAGSGGLLQIKKASRTVISEFVESGRWNLAASFGGEQTIFVFTKK